MLSEIAKIIDDGGPLCVKYCVNTSQWVMVNKETVIETYNDHDKAEDECERLNNLIIARNVVKIMSVYWEATIDIILAEEIVM